MVVSAELTTATLHRALFTRPVSFFAELDHGNFALTLICVEMALYISKT